MTDWPVWATEPVEIKDYNPNWKEKGLTLKKELYQIRRKTPCFSHGDIRHFALIPLGMLRANS